MAPSRSPFRGQPVSRDDLPMTLYHLTPEGLRVTLISVGEQAVERQEGRRMTQREGRGGEEWCEGRGKAHRRFVQGSSGRGEDEK